MITMHPTRRVPGRLQTIAFALAALIAAIVVWFARHPILELFGIDTDADDEDDGYYPQSEH